MSKKLGPSGSPGAKWKDLRELVQVAAFAHPKFRTGFWMEDVERRTLLQERFAEHCVVQYVQYTRKHAKPMTRTCAVYVET